LTPRKTILLLHLAGQVPLAGFAWQALHYMLGLRRLGHDVWYIEDSGAPPYDPRRQAPGADCRYNVAFLRNMMERFDLGDRWAYWDRGAGEWHGLSGEAVRALYGKADALLNLSGATHLREEHLACPVRILVDTDPGYEQTRLAEGDAEAARTLDAHTHLFTYGENLGRADCTIPLGGRRWRATRPPVLLDLWDAGCIAAGPFFTSVATWENKGRDVAISGETYRWSKHVNFLRFLELPRRTLQPCRLAMAPANEGVAAQIREAGWDLVDPVPISADMQPYRDFIVTSRGEFTVAKDIYVRGRTGWFSDRSVCYLAAGRPVVTQDTGFSKLIPSGKGLYAFSSLEEIREAIARINHDYERECHAAREIAHEFFDADRVLRELLRQAEV
jgi:Glycosyl transferases group 1